MIRNAGPLHYRKRRAGGYETTAEWWFISPVRGGAFVLRDADGFALGRMAVNGCATVSAFFSWGGASGPVIDRRANMAASCAHDWLYLAHRQGLLTDEERDESDVVYRELYIERASWVPEAEIGAPWYRRALRSVGKTLSRISAVAIGHIDYAGLRLFGRWSADRQAEVEQRRLVS